jgi:hypothetical protein
MRKFRSLLIREVRHACFENTVHSDAPRATRGTARIGFAFWAVFLFLLGPLLCSLHGEEHSFDYGLVPPSLAAGNPPSSYAASAIDNVNLYNGNLNVTVPLLDVSGRGEAGYPLITPIQRRWFTYGNSQPCPRRTRSTWGRRRRG